MKNKKSLIILLCIFTVVFLAMFILNEYTVFTSDDYSFLYEYKMWPFPNLKRVTNISQIIKSMEYLYQNVNGRIVPHFILQLLLIFPKYIFNIFNSLAFVILGVLIYQISLKKDNLLKDFKPAYLIIIYSLLFLIIPDFGISVLWCSGSLNYLWMSIIILLYFKYYNQLIKKKKTKICDYLIISIIGFASCNGPENYSIATIAFSTIYPISSLIKTKKVKLFQIIGWLSNILGIIILFTGGSSYGRISNISISLKTIISQLAAFIKNNTVIYLFCMLVLSISIILSIKNKEKKSDDYQFHLYCFTGLISICSLFIAPYLPNRALLLSVILFIICIINFLSKFNKNIIKYFMVISLVFALVVFINPCFKDVYNSYQEFKIIETSIINQKNQGLKNITVADYKKKYSNYTAFHNDYAYITNDEFSWTNMWIAHYYDVNSISIKN